MKKLVVTAAVMCVAAMSQAAAIKWATGNLYAPTDAAKKDGSIGSSAGGPWTFNAKLTDSVYKTIELYVWESTTAFTVNENQLWDWYAGGKSGQAITGLDALTGSATYNSGFGTYSGNIVGPTHDKEGGSFPTVYGAMLIVAKDSKGEAQMYMENTASKSAGSSTVTVSNLGNLVGGTGSNHTAWTIVGGGSVPEPTSGLLVMLGVGLMALRRRRA